MRKFVIRKPREIAPFNQPARDLRVLNKPLWLWQRDLLSAYGEEPEHTVNSFEEIPFEAVETVVYSDNLWFDHAFLEAFIEEVRGRGKPARAAFRSEDPAYLQQGLRQLSRSYDQRGDLYYVDLWYFPQGVARQVEPVILSSDAQEIGYYSIPSYLSDRNKDLVWWLPERAVCAIDTWVHVFFINIVFGVFAEAFRSEQRSKNPMFRFQASLRSLIERKSVLGSSAYVQVGKNCSIDDSTIFQGPVTIGDNVTIGPGCVITQCIIGSNVTLTHGNHLHMSVIGDDCFFPWGASAHFTVFMKGASAGNNSCLDMSVVGCDSYVGSGTIFTDFNLLPMPLTVTVDGEPVEIDMPVLGACVGHNVRVGSGLVVYPGRSIESDVVLIPSPTRRVIMQDISYEESDHHATLNADLHPRLYPREDERRGS